MEDESALRGTHLFEVKRFMCEQDRQIATSRLDQSVALRSPLHADAHTQHHAPRVHSRAVRAIGHDYAALILGKTVSRIVEGLALKASEKRY